MKKVRSHSIDDYLRALMEPQRSTQIRMRERMAEVVPAAIETTSYFDMPGYSYEGYDYNGMFAWFSFKAPFIRLHVRPAAISRHQKQLERYAHTKAIVSFPVDQPLPKTLIKKCVKASLKDMIQAAK